jgi:hypothetical protein
MRESYISSRGIDCTCDECRLWATCERFALETPQRQDRLLVSVPFYDAIKENRVTAWLRPFSKAENNGKLKPLAQ